MFTACEQRKKYDHNISKKKPTPKQNCAKKNVGETLKYYSPDVWGSVVWTLGFIWQFDQGYCTKSISKIPLKLPTKKNSDKTYLATLFSLDFKP